MKVDFWQLSASSAEQVTALIADRVLRGGGRVLVVHGDGDRHAALSDTLWNEKADAFLANGLDGAGHEARQPILIADQCTRANAADHVIFADGRWRDAAGFARAFLLFDEATLDHARRQWRDLGATEGLERSFYRQDGGRWTKVA